jgi:hypothetical protein
LCAGKNIQHFLLLVILALIRPALKAKKLNENFVRSQTDFAVFAQCRFNFLRKKEGETQKE